MMHNLCSLTRDELCYVLDPQDVYGSDFPGEPFRVLKEKEMKAYGDAAQSDEAARRRWESRTKCVQQVLRTADSRMMKASRSTAARTRWWPIADECHGQDQFCTWRSMILIIAIRLTVLFVAIALYS